jgi:hypothetical protein
VQVNLAYRWYCKLSIEDTIPDHSIFCRARHDRFRESDALRRVLESLMAKGENLLLSMRLPLNSAVFWGGHKLHEG